MSPRSPNSSTGRVDPAHGPGRLRWAERVTAIPPANAPIISISSRWVVSDTQPQKAQGEPEAGLRRWPSPSNNCAMELTRRVPDSMSPAELADRERRAAEADRRHLAAVRESADREGFALARWRPAGACRIDDERGIGFRLSGSRMPQCALSRPSRVRKPCRAASVNRTKARSAWMSTTSEVAHENETKTRCVA